MKGTSRSSVSLRKKAPFTFYIVIVIFLTKIITFQYSIENISQTIESMEYLSRGHVIPNTNNIASENQIRKIAILGERHSGTTWIYEHLQECFDYSMRVDRHLTRYKHWFQYDDGKKHNKVLVISLFRDPYAWIEAMRRAPHHSPSHLNLPWNEFVTKPWTMPRVGKDLEITNKTGRICQEKFYYNEVTSCLKYVYPEGYFIKNKKPAFSGHQPLYELRNDQSGKPFDSVLELRTAKILNFFSVTDYNFVHDFWPMQYENLVKEGTENLLKDIELVTGVKARCSASAPQTSRKVRAIQPSLKKWIDTHLDWDVEKLVGYYKSK